MLLLYQFDCTQLVVSLVQAHSHMHTYIQIVYEFTESHDHFASSRQCTITWRSFVYSKFIINCYSNCIISYCTLFKVLILYGLLYVGTMQ